MSQGMVVYGRDGEPTFDTRKPRLQVALNQDPAHMDIINVRATAIRTLAVNYPTPTTEVLFTTKHNLGYKPKVLVYFFIPSTQLYSTGTHYHTPPNALSDDLILYDVTDTTFSITHRLTDYFGVFDLTSTANTLGDIRVKYMIFSNPVENVTNDVLADT